jgi:hypothetical protein
VCAAPQAHWTKTGLNQGAPLRRCSPGLHGFSEFRVFLPPAIECRQVKSHELGHLDIREAKCEKLSRPLTQLRAKPTRTIRGLAIVLRRRRRPGKWQRAARARALGLLPIISLLGSDKQVALYRWLVPTFSRRMSSLGPAVLIIGSRANRQCDDLQLKERSTSRPSPRWPRSLGPRAAW